MVSHLINARRSIAIYIIKKVVLEADTDSSHIVSMPISLSIGNLRLSHVIKIKYNFSIVIPSQISTCWNYSHLTTSFNIFQTT